MTKKIDIKKVEETQATTTNEIVNLQERLRAELEQLNYKKKLADKRDLFILKKQSLDQFLDEIRQESTDGNFEMPRAKISFVIEKTDGYRNDERFNITIPEMIESYAIQLLADIDNAIEGLEKELIEC